EEIVVIPCLPNRRVKRLETSVPRRLRQCDKVRTSHAPKRYLVPLNRRNGVVESRYRSAPKICPGRFRRRENRALDFFFAHDGAHRSLARQLVEQSLVRLNVVILEIECLKPWIGP